MQQPTSTLKFVQHRRARLWRWWIGGSACSVMLAFTGGALLLPVLGSLLGSSFGAVLIVTTVQATALHVFVQPRPGQMRQIALRWLLHSWAAGVGAFLLFAPWAFLVIMLGLPGYPNAASARSHAIIAVATTAVCWGMAGAAIGVAQMIALRRGLPEHRLWIIVSALGWAGIGATTTWSLLSDKFVQWPLPSLMVTAGSGLLAGGLHGTLTGAALLRVLRLRATPRAAS